MQWDEAHLVLLLNFLHNPLGYLAKVVRHNEQERVDFLSSRRCAHSTRASILKTPIRAKQVIFSLHLVKAVGSDWTSIQNHSNM
jgi:hypothetical protein